MPDITADALAIVTSRGGALWTSRRVDAESSWGPFVKMDGAVNSEEREIAGSLSADGKLLVFQRRPKNAFFARSGRTFDSTLWMTSRSGWDAEWSEPIELSSLRQSSHSYLQHPRLLPDGKTLLYSANHSSTDEQFETDYESGFDFYLARLVRRDASQAEPRSDGEGTNNEPAVTEASDE